jgi:hypothetical protein
VAPESADGTGDCRERLQQELEARLRHQAAVAAVGQRALAGASFAELLADIVSIIQTNLGVDLVGALRWLARFGCPLVQGFLVARPVSGDDVPAVAATRRWAEPLQLAGGGR